ncbi:MAG TPA: hypothetical protein VL096_07905 [Pirellulaceae bacterium]|nr:hypothetical protein [Pirellulaceae bacterium]
MLIGILCFIAFAIFASLYLESFWSNAITLINVTLATLLSISFYEPVAALIDKQLGSFTYLWDYLSLWLMFVVIFAMLRFCTDFVTRNRVKFKLPVEMAGRMLCAAAVAGVMVSFIMTSFHIAPLPPSPFSNGLASSPAGGDFVGLSPDYYFLGFVRYTSNGSLARGQTFNANNDFTAKYHARRKNLNSVPDSLRVNQ